jgi:hypothetical protein
MVQVRNVKLLRDYSHVHPNLQVGTIGILKENVGFDSNFRVYFPTVGENLNLFENSFEYLKTPEEQLIYDQKIATAYDVVYETGPKHGYRLVTFKYTQPMNGVENIYFRGDGIKILDYFKQHGIPVTTIRLPK